MKTYRERWRVLMAEALAKLAAKAGDVRAREEALNPALLVMENPPRPAMGDIAFPMFPFASGLRKTPPTIAREVVEVITESGAARGEGEAEAAGPYVNIRLARAPVIAEVLQEIEEKGAAYGRGAEMSGKRVLLEFSCPNTNKPLHIGHLRNDALGESLSRILASSGADLHKVNLINDRGVHICQSMLAYRLYGDATTPQSQGIKGDHFVGDYYVRYNQHVKEHPEAEEQVRDMLRKWESGDPEVVALWRTMNEWVISGIEETYRRTGVSFDQVYLESRLYLLGRDEVNAGLRKGIFQQEPDGSVWVDLSSLQRYSADSLQGLDREVLLRSDGTSLYLTQDIGTAIQRYKDWPFDRSIYVVGSEQRRHFRVLFLVLELLGYPWASSLYHLAYGMVNLPEGKMKSREGTVVDADDLLDELERLAEAEIRNKEREDDVGDLSRTAREIALGALNYWLLQVTPGKDMTFDPGQSISFNGNTGPYLQYTGARIASMLRKFAERRERYSGGLYSPRALNLPEEWEMLKMLASYPEKIAEAARDLNPSVVAVHLYELCKGFSRYYQEHQVLRNADAGLVVSRIELVKGILGVLKNGLALLGIPFLEAM